MEIARKASLKSGSSPFSGLGIGHERVKARPKTPAIDKTAVNIHG